MIKLYVTQKGSGIVLRELLNLFPPIINCAIQFITLQLILPATFLSRVIIVETKVGEYR
jgi:hypothetical protein